MICKINPLALHLCYKFKFITYLQFIFNIHKKVCVYHNARNC